MANLMFNGQLLPCKVEHFPAIRKPARKFTKYNVPGRNGDIIVPQNAWENIVVSYDVYAGDPDNTPLQDIWNSIADILYQPGYCVLEDDYDLDIFREGVFMGGIEAENSWNLYGRATLEFDCKPQKWLRTGQDWKTINPGGTDYIWNTTHYDAKPLIYVKMTPNSGGSGTVIVGDKTLTITDLVGQFVYLDCDSQDAYYGTSNLNGCVSGDYPVLSAAGEFPTSTTLNYTGDIEQCKIMPRFWKL